MQFLLEYTLKRSEVPDGKGEQDVHGRIFTQEVQPSRGACNIGIRLRNQKGQRNEKSYERVCD